MWSTYNMQSYDPYVIKVSRDHVIFLIHNISRILCLTLSFLAAVTHQVSSSLCFKWIVTCPAMAGLQLLVFASPLNSCPTKEVLDITEGGRDRWNTQRHGNNLTGRRGRSCDPAYPMPLELDHVIPFHPHYNRELMWSHPAHTTYSSSWRGAHVIPSHPHIQ